VALVSRPRLKTLAIVSPITQGAKSNYLDVTDAQRSALSAERDAAQIATQRLLAAVAVARSLGGGWTDSAAH